MALHLQSSVDQILRLVFPSGASSRSISTSRLPTRASIRPSLHLARASGEAPAAVAAPPAAAAPSVSPALLTCRQCKQPFDPQQNHKEACAFHPAHYGGEVKRKWKSYSYHQVGKQFLYHSEETKAGWGEVENFWDCCGRNDPTDLGCTKGPHKSYDDA